MEDLLTTDSVGPYLVERGLIEPGAKVESVELGGGISNVVMAVRAGNQRFVVKQSLPRLRVKDDWPAKRERVVTEAEALRLAGQITPGAVPEVLDCDEASFVVTLAKAPEIWRNWKTVLLSGETDAYVASELGRVLATWHSNTKGSPEIEKRFNDIEAFEQLRVDPYYRTVMKRRPEVAATVSDYVDEMAKRRLCLVHGDYSPKNVLIGEKEMWTLDFEVAHFGDPAFDVAFMLNHLCLKAIHKPDRLDGYRLCGLSFWNAYVAEVGEGFAGAESYVLGHLACLMAARVDGKSPAEYLLENERSTAREIAISWLTEPPSGIEAAWTNLQERLPL